MSVIIRRFRLPSASCLIWRVFYGLAAENWERMSGEGGLFEWDQLGTKNELTSARIETKKIKITGIERKYFLEKRKLYFQRFFGRKLWRNDVTRFWKE